MFPFHPPFFSRAEPSHDLVCSRWPENNGKCSIHKTIQAFGCSKFAPIEDLPRARSSPNSNTAAEPEANAPEYCGLVAREPIFKQDAKDQGRTRAASLERANRRLVDPPRMTQRPVTAVETGILSFHAALLGQILHPTGEIVHERMASAEAAVRGGRG